MVEWGVFARETDLEPRVVSVPAVVNQGNWAGEGLCDLASLWYKKM